MMALSARWHARRKWGDKHSGRAGGGGRGRRRTPFSRNRWDMQQDASGEDVAVTSNTLRRVNLFVHGAAKIGFSIG